MRPVVVPSLAALTVVALFGVTPATVVAGSHWLCGLSDDSVRLVCIADSSPHVNAPESDGADATPHGAATVQTKVAAVVNGTVFPLDTKRQYVVELWTPPSDMAFVEQLARATICYRSPGCAVSFVETREAMAALPATALTRRR